MQVVDINGNVFGAGLEVTGPDGKPKTISGGGGPIGPAGPIGPVDPPPPQQLLHPPPQLHIMAL